MAKRRWKQLAEELVHHRSAGALRRTKAFLDRRLPAELDREIEAAKEEFRQAVRTQDARRGLEAFRRKEAVRWSEE